MDPLHDYAMERKQLLHSIVSFLERDPAVKAAWLLGSLGRGEADYLSDIDIWVVMEDECIPGLLVHPDEFISRPGSPILRLEAPQNAPRGGVYRMACYDAPVAPHIVDWYWQPRSRAFIFPDVKIILNPAGIPFRNEPLEFSGTAAPENLTALPVHFTTFFWMMWMITAKYAFRFPAEGEMELLPYLTGALSQARTCLGLPAQIVPATPPHPDFQGKLSLLSSLADQMTQYMDSLFANGETVPMAVIPGAYRYIEMIRSRMPR
jgi:hypothetical protein